MATSQQILSKFIWSGKPSKVKHSIIIQDYKLSGLRGPCMETINMSLRLAWLARLSDKSLWNSVVHQDFDKYGGLKLVLHSYFDHTRIEIPSFYKDMLLYFERLNILQPHKGVLWHNRDLMIGSKSLFRPDWLSKGIVYIKDLLGINATALSLEELQLKFNLEVHTQIDILWYNGLKVKIKKWLTIEENQQYIQDNYKVDFDSPLFYKRASVLNIKRARCRDYTEWIISEKEEKPTSLTFWNKVGIANEETVLRSLNSCKNATKETTLIAMQFKIIHNIIATNKRKKDWGINESDKCSFCNNEDTLDHALWECIFTQDVLAKCLSMLNLTILNISKEQFMLGCDEMAMDNVLLIIKKLSIIFAIQQ